MKVITRRQMDAAIREKDTNTVVDFFGDFLEAIADNLTTYVEVLNHVSELSQQDAAFNEQSVEYNSCLALLDDLHQSLSTIMGSPVPESFQVIWNAMKITDKNQFPLGVIISYYEILLTSAHAYSEVIDSAVREELKRLSEKQKNNEQ